MVSTQTNSFKNKNYIYLPLTSGYPFPQTWQDNVQVFTITVYKESQKQSILSALASKKNYGVTEVFVGINPTEVILDKNTNFSKKTNRYVLDGFVCQIVISKLGFEQSEITIDTVLPIEALKDNLKYITIKLVPICQASIKDLDLKQYEIDDKTFNCIEGIASLVTVENDIPAIQETDYYTQLYKAAREYIAENPENFSVDVSYKFSNFDKPITIPLDQYPNYVLQTLGLPIRYFNKYLKIKSLKERYIDLAGYLVFMVNRNAFDTSLNNHIRENVEKNQRNYYINEQIRTLRSELNNGNDNLSEKEHYLKLLEEKVCPQEVREKLTAEINRLEQMQPSTPEANIQRTYIEWILNTPWTGDNIELINLQKSREILNTDHYGIEDVKERVLEYLAVLSRVKLTKSPILCLIGPPGVGKTSLGESIARATGRKYTRLALGGVSDEAEIRGHRRTYVGAQPGRIIQHLNKLKVNNPLFLLDEIDKLTANHRGDPGAALLEVLDPEQNNKFTDNYIEFEYDLSNVLFLATANSYNIPEALLDRMEIINLGSYTRDEKFEIAKRHILPKIIKRNGIQADEIEFPDYMINFIVDGYTNEAGVRSLERRIERIIRYAIKEIIEKGISKVVVNENLVETILGPIVNEMSDKIRDGASIGLITGLAYTSAGGDVLPIEVATIPGKGEILNTGSLGNNITESIRAAITVIRQRVKQFDLPEDFYKSTDFHIHFPNAAVQKDGPSAGAAITTCIISALTKKPIDKDIGMTGEITLMGNVLKIGGVKEKVISAHRNGVRHIILPKSNVPDLHKIPDKIKNELQFYPVTTIDEVVDIVFGNKKRPTKTKDDLAEILTKQELHEIDNQINQEKLEIDALVTEVVKQDNKKKSKSSSKQQSSKLSTESTIETDLTKKKSTKSAKPKVTKNSEKDKVKEDKKLEKTKAKSKIIKTTKLTAKSNFKTAVTKDQKETTGLEALTQDSLVKTSDLFPQAEDTAINEISSKANIKKSKSAKTTKTSKTSKTSTTSKKSTVADTSSTDKKTATKVKAKSKVTKKSTTTKK